MKKNEARNKTKKSEMSPACIRVNPKTWSEFKVWCYSQGKYMNEVLDDILKEILKEGKNGSKSK